jgi:uncharacterized protein Usg
MRKELVLVGVVYYRPDFIHLLNEFYWQTDDVVPDLPRVHKFLNYWRTEIGVPIKDVFISVAASEYRSTSFYKVLH